VSAKTTWDTELYEAKHNFVWKLGSDVLALLHPQPGETILDLGCGTGHLTQKIAQSGASAVGLDSSPDMIGQARQNFPTISFVLGDGAKLPYREEFDAVFSNAALHWMTDPEPVASGIAKALRPGGRLVAEFGGKGNISRILAAIENVLPEFYGSQKMPAARTYFPSIVEYGALLEKQGLELQFGQLFDRPTPLEGVNGLGDWIKQFKWYYFEALAREDRQKALQKVVEQLRPALWRTDHWVADYRRLRIIAVKP
jgi:trans-aconitate methyltransferase